MAVEEMTYEQGWVLLNSAVTKAAGYEVFHKKPTKELFTEVIDYLYNVEAIDHSDYVTIIIKMPFGYEVLA